MASSSTRALNAILPQIATAPYEAHQKARTFASRYVKSGQYDTAIDVLFQSARELLKVGQAGSGVDLAGFLLEVYEAKGEEITEESRGRLTQLIALTGSGGAWRKTLIDKSIAWSAKWGDCPAGDQTLHHYVGELLYKEGAFDLAEPHFLASGQRDSARLLARMFIGRLAEGDTPGTFALRGTITYLQNGNILAARTFIKNFAAMLPEDMRSPSISVGGADRIIPTKDLVVNFAQKAVVICGRADRDDWLSLCMSYQMRCPVLGTMPMRRAFKEIASLHCPTPPPPYKSLEYLCDLIASTLTPAQRRRFSKPAGGSSPRRV